MASLKRNLISLIMMQGLNYLIPLMTLPYLTRTLGLYNYGLLGTAMSLIQYAILFTDFGFNLSASKAIAQNKQNKLKISQVFWETLQSKALLAGIALLTLFLITNTVAKYQNLQLILVCLSVQVIGSVLLPTWFFQGIEKLDTLAIINTAVRFMTLPLLFIFVRTPDDVIIAAFIQASVFLIMGIISLAIIYSQHLVLPLGKVSINTLTSIKASAPIFIGTAAISLYTLSTPIILSLVSNYNEVGLYSAADKLRGALLGIFLVLGQAFYPRINSLLSQEPLMAFNFLKRIIKFQLMASIAICFLFYWLMPLLAPLILGEDFLHTGALLKLMAPMALIVPLSIICANYLLLPLGYKKMFALLPLVMACIHLPVTWQLSKLFGSLGAATAILITESINLICLLIITNKLGLFKRSFYENYNLK